MGHYYQVRNGLCTPMYQVAKRDGGMRDTTVADARKNRWLPSVNEILSIQANPFLSDWLTQQALEFGFRAGYDDSTTGLVEEHLQQCKEAWLKESSLRADAGTFIHDQVFEIGLKTKTAPQDEASRTIYEKILEVTQGISFDREHGAFVEESFGSNVIGYAGRCDCIGIRDGSLHGFDLKTIKTDRKPYDKEWRQIAAYKKLLSALGHKVDSFSLLLFRQEDGKFFGKYTLESKEEEKRFKEFEACFNLWRVAKDYDPRSTEEAW